MIGPEYETGTLDAQQPGSERSDSARLNQRADTGHKQRHTHQEPGIGGRQFQGTGNNQRGCDDTDEDGKHVLQSHERSLS